MLKKRVWLTPLFIFFLVLVGGCVNRSVVKPASSDYWVTELHQNALTQNSLSKQAAVYLELRGWDEKAMRDADKVLSSLKQRLVEEPDRKGLLVFAELAYLAGKKTDDSSRESSFYLTACRAAYAVMFDSSLGPPLDEMDPDLRFAADLYNHSLSALAEQLLCSGHANDEPLVLDLLDQELHVSRGNGLRDFGAFDQVIISYNFRTEALSWHNRRRGLGAPVVTLKKRQALIAGHKQVHPPVFESSVAPATLLLRFENPWSDESGSLHAETDLVHSFGSTHTEMGGKRIPLEADTSLALALIYGEKSEYRGYQNMLRFLHGNYMGENRGLYLLEPYDPSRIPVVFTHGLMDSSLTWVPMINELYADPALTERYQFWVFFYPTGNPILQSASELRQSLLALRAQKEQQNEAWDNMVFVGHSMGGLITRLMVTDSENLLGNAEEYIAAVAEGDRELQGYLESLSSFESFPSAKRAVFIAAPHRGANMAGRLAGKTGSVLIDEPDYLKEFIEAEDGREERLKNMENGIDNLAKDSVFSLALGDSQWNPSIPVHSIIGDIHTAGKTTGSDGLVAYWSSHVDGAESELILKADHMTIHKTPASIAEVRRILLKHLEESGSPLSD